MKEVLIENLIKETYLELNKIRADINVSETSEMMRFSIIAIEISLGLFQLGLFNNREINSFEENWFKGGFHIHYNLDGGWGKLADNYSMIVEITTGRNFFRTG